MINLSKKAAERFNIKWVDLNEQSGDFWKIDIIMVSHYPVLFMIHELTLYTLVRRKKDFKTINDIANEIKSCCHWYKYTGEIILGKNTNRKLNGSITEIKRIIAGEYTSNFTEEIQDRINTCLFSYLSEEKYGYDRPIDVIEKYKRNQLPNKI